MTDDTRICIAEFDGWKHLRNWHSSTQPLSGEHPDTGHCYSIPDLTIDYLRDVRVRRFTDKMKADVIVYLRREINALDTSDATAEQVANAMVRVIKEGDEGK